MRARLPRRSTLIPAALFGVLAVGIVLAGVELSRAQERALMAGVATTADQTAERIRDFLLTRIGMVTMLARAYRHGTADTRETFAEQALALQLQFKSFQAINWIGADGTIRWVVPEEGNFPARGADLSRHADPSVRQALDGARRTLRPHMSGPVELLQGRRGVGVYVPVAVDGDVVGFVNGVFRLAPLMARVLDDPLKSRFALRFRDGNALVYGHGDPEAAARYRARRTLSILNRTWVLELAPTPAAVAEQSSPVDEAVVVLALALAGGAAVLLRLFMRRHEDDLLDSRRRFADLVELSYDWVWEMGPDLRFTYLSRRHEDVTGIRAEELIGRTPIEMVGADTVAGDPAKWHSHFATLERHQPFSDHQFIVRNRSGRSTHIRLSGKPVFNGDGTFRGYWGVGSDVTAEVLALDQARQARSRLMNAIENSSEGFALFDDGDRLVLSNRRFAEMFGAVPDATRPGIRFEDLHRILAEAGVYHADMGEPLRVVAARLKTHRDTPAVYEQHLADGRWIQLAEHRTREGGTSLFVTDVTALKDRETERRERELAEKSALLQATLDNIPAGVCVFSRELKVLAANDRLFELLDLPRGWAERTDLTYEAIARYNAERGEFGPGNAEAQVRARVERSLRFEPHVAERTRPDGTVLEIRGLPMPGGGLVSVFTDVTERHRAEMQVRESEQRLRRILEAANEAIMITDAENRIEFVNPAFTHYTGYLPAEVAGRKPHFLKSGRHPAAFYRAIRTRLQEDGHWQGEIWNRRKSGEFIAAWVSLATLQDEGGRITHYISVSQDITHRKEDEDRIWRQANFDVLTGLPNRSLFLDRLEQAVKHAHREREVFALMFLDLDGFKQVNDTYGHAAGDLLLQETARRLQGCVRATDTVARLAGDEFTVILQDAKAAGPVERIARAILERLSEPFDLDGTTASVQASIGIALYPGHAEDACALLKQADDAMYRVKRAGKNGVAFTSDPAPDPPSPPPEE